MHDLPAAFLQRMKDLLGEEYEAFLKSYEENRTFGLRVNTLKLPVEYFLKISPFALEPIPWIKEGFYYHEEERPGKHPYHVAGLYYLQDPSAMAVVELLDIKPGERVLDLCGAPGGKATQAGARLQGKGILVANEIHPSRAKILSENIERMGMINAVVTQESPQRLAGAFSHFFDKIIVDAPCSGEGMFRKDPDACREWSENSPYFCSIRQEEILEAAAGMLRAGGKMVYSTCTFAPEENEGTISSFLKNHPEFELMDVQRYPGFSPGRNEWANGGVKVDKAVRLWPHKVKGEGHFIALMEKKDGEDRSQPSLQQSLKEKDLREFNAFRDEYLLDIYLQRFLLFGEELYAFPEGMVDIKGLRVLRPGWHLGTMKRNRFQPGHALALGLKSEQIRYRLNFSSRSEDVIAYLKGQTLAVHGQKGWHGVLVDGFPIGWGKISDGTLKNHYPKGLRWY